MSWMMKTEGNDTNSNETTNIRQKMDELKRQKARKKSAFTKSRRAMLILFDEDLPSRGEVRSQQPIVKDCHKEAISAMEPLTAMFTAAGDQDQVSKRSIKNWIHWRGSVHQHKTKHKNIWAVELMKNQVYRQAGQLEVYRK